MGARTAPTDEPARTVPALAARVMLGLAAVLAALVVAACGDDEPSPLPQAATPVTIETEDGVQLDGRLFESRTTHLVLFVHAFQGSQSDWFTLARSFAASSRAAALTFDFRGYGLSGGERATDRSLVTDINAAVAYGRSLGYRSIVVIGASMGGTAAIIAAAENPQIEGVIALSPPARFGDLNAIEAIEARKPLFAVIAAREDVSAMDSMRTLADAADLIPRFRFSVSGEAHGTELLTAVSAESVRRRIDAMLTEIWDAP